MDSRIREKSFLPMAGMTVFGPLASKPSSSRTRASMLSMPTYTTLISSSGQRGRTLKA